MASADGHLRPGADALGRQTADGILRPEGADVGSGGTIFRSGTNFSTAAHSAIESIVDSAGNTVFTAHSGQEFIGDTGTLTSVATQTGTGTVVEAAQNIYPVAIDSAEAVGTPTVTVGEAPAPEPTPTPLPGGLPTPVTARRPGPRRQLGRRHVISKPSAACVGLQSRVCVSSGTGSACAGDSSSRVRATTAISTAAVLSTRTRPLVALPTLSTSTTAGVTAGIVAKRDGPSIEELLLLA